MGESRPPQTPAGRAVVRGRRETVGGPDLAPAGHAEVLEQRLETVVDARGVPSAVGPRLAGLVRFASSTSRREVQYARRAPSWGSLRGRGFGVKSWYSVCRREDAAPAGLAEVLERREAVGGLDAAPAGLQMLLNVRVWGTV